MMHNPCYKCPHSDPVIKMKRIIYAPNYFAEHNECKYCAKRAEYERQKAENRKYINTYKPINSLLNFIKYCENHQYIFWNYRLWHIQAFKCNQYSIIENAIFSKNVFEAVERNDCYCTSHKKFAKLYKKGNPILIYEIDKKKNKLDRK